MALLLPSSALCFTPSGLLEIHQINVQQGDCTLIIGPDGTTFLIDAGKNAKGTGEVVPYLQSIGLMPADGLDYMLATHRDSDHLGGLDEVINAGYDVRHNVWDNGSTKTGTAISDFLNAAATTTAGPVTEMAVGTLVPLGNGATAHCVASHGNVLGFGAVAGALNNENDMCVAILVQYGDFDYITAGDLGGGEDDSACTGRTTTQVNVETVLATSLMPGGGAALLTPDGVEVLDVDHHGSESSTNSDYMNLLTPSVAVINVGPGQGGNYMHPRKDVVENVLMAQAACITAPPALVLQTEEGAPTGSLTSFAGYCSGDVAIKTSGLSTFEVSGTGAVSAGPDERVAAGIEPPADFNLDSSSGSGDVTPPSVTLFTPDGGETWQAGASEAITWTASDDVGVTSVDLLYSANGSGGTYSVIASDEANDGTYDWTIPNDPTANAFVKVVAHDAAGNTGEDISNLAFTIEAGSAPVLVINEIMQDPNAVSDTNGEWLEIYNAGATAADINGWTIRDDGSDSHVINNGGPLVVPAGGYVVLGRDGSSATNGGYTPDYVYTSFLLANTADEVILQDPMGTIVDRVDYTGASPWPNPTGASMELADAGSDNNAGGNWATAIARGGSYVGGGDFGTPGAPNSITTPPDVTPPTVAVSTPNGGESWGTGSVHAITWSASDDVGVTSVDLLYSTTGSGGSYTTIATGEGNDGTYSWTIPDTPSSSAFVKVVAHDGAGNSGEDVSGAAFSITDATAPVVAVSTPNGGESWDVGSVQAITWSASDNIAVTSIDLAYSTSGSGGPYTSIASGEANDGTFDWTIPDAPSTTAFVRVTAHDAGGNSGEDVSNTAFTIQAPVVASIVINEIMQNPAAVSDSRGEWVELFNPGSTPVDINGWTLRDDGSDIHTISNGGPLMVPAGGYLVLGRNGSSNRNGHYSPDYVYSSFQLANEADKVILEDTFGTEVDRVEYSGVSPWPNPSGASMELADAGTDNNVGGNWAEAIARGGTYTGNGDLGTPGALNSVSGGAKPAPIAVAQSVAWKLGNAEPNPFNPATTIRFAVQKPDQVMVRVFDVRGRWVATLVNERLESGWHDVEWRGLDRDNRPVSSGVYFVRMDASAFTDVRRITLVR